MRIEQTHSSYIDKTKVIIIISNEKKSKDNGREKFKRKKLFGYFIFLFF